MDAPSSSSASTVTTVAAAAVLVTAAVNCEKIKKTTTTIVFEGMVSSSFNIQYQSTRVGPLSSLDENELN